MEGANEMRTRIAMAVASLALACALVPSHASAHGETATTTPENGAAIKSPPKSVSVDLTEPPAQGAEFTVTDGCNEVVSGSSSVEGSVLSTSIQGGVAGKWKAQYRVVSAVDGHLTKDSWTFSVRGKKDCTPDEKKGNDKKDNTDRANGEDPSDPDLASDQDDGGGFPVIPVLVGTALLVALALGIRLRSSR